VRKISPPPTGIRSPDRPARRESLHRLSYPGPTTNCNNHYLHGNAICYRRSELWLEDRNGDTDRCIAILSVSFSIRMQHPWPLFGKAVDTQTHCEGTPHLSKHRRTFLSCWRRGHTCNIYIETTGNSNLMLKHSFLQSFSAQLLYISLLIRTGTRNY